MSTLRCIGLLAGLLLLALWLQSGVHPATPATPSTIEALEDLDTTGDRWVHVQFVTNRQEQIHHYHRWAAITSLIETPDGTELVVGGARFHLALSVAELRDQLQRNNDQEGIQ